jgi:hypothetical protein
MHAIRSGHTAVTFIGEGGRATHLFWGGTADGPYAEYYHESAGQSDGIFSPFVPAEFLDSNSYKKRPLFHTMTPLGDGQFLLAGGVLIKSGKLTTPSAGDSFIIDLASNGKIGVATVDGLGLGRYFHQAISSGSQALVLGGFTTKVSGEHGLFGALAASDARLFDSRKKGGFVSFEDAASAARGGGAAVLSGSQMLVAGGIVDLYVDLEGHADSVPLRTEALTPSFLCPEELWSTGCIAQ